MEQFHAEWHAWHDERTLALAAPHGWLSVTALRWLGAGDNRFDDLLGTWTVQDEWVRLTLGPGETAGPTADTLRLAGDHPQSGRTVDLDVQGGFGAQLEPGQSLLWVSSGSIVYELIRRGRTYGVRVRDSNSPLLRSFHGVPTFAPDCDWVGTGVFSPYEHPVSHTVETAWPGLQAVAVSPGTVAFEHEGQELVLHATGSPETGLTVQFSDASSGVLTPAWRTLSLGVPDSQNRVVLDFNRAVNMPFAFTPFATCPAPIQGNQLPFPVWAGERRPAQTLGRSGVNCPVLVIRNDLDARLGEFGEWWKQAGLDLVTVDVTAGERIPPLTGFKAVVVLGSEVGPDGCAEEERSLLADALAERVPTLGLGAGDLLAQIDAPRSTGEGRPVSLSGPAERVGDLAWLLPRVPAISSAGEATEWRGFAQRFAELARSGGA